MVRPKCIFCGLNKYKESREDVFPRWLARTFPDGKRLTFFNFTGPRSQVVSGAKHRAFSRGKGSFGLLARGVCEKCNNGWMSKLERDVSVILGPIARGQATTLSVKEQELVARWVLKTLLMFEHRMFQKHAHQTRSKKQHFGEMDRQALYRNLPIPDSTFVYLAHFVSPMAVVSQDPSYSSYKANARPDFPLLALYKQAVAINHLAFQLCAFRWPEEFLPVDGPIRLRLNDPWTLALVQIWPSLARVRWPPDLALDGDGYIALADRPL